MKYVTGSMIVIITLFMIAAMGTLTTTTAQDTHAGHGEGAGHGAGEKCSACKENGEHGAGEHGEKCSACTGACGMMPMSADMVRPLLIGASVPGGPVRTIDGESTCLKKTVMGEPTVVVFYRGGWCGYCRGHLENLEALKGDLADLGFRIIVVSPDKPGKLAETRDKLGISYTLISDSDMRGATNYGIAYQVDDETLKHYNEYEIVLGEYSGRNHTLLPVPSVFIVDAGGTVQFTYVNPNYRERLTDEVILAMARAAIVEE